MEMIRSSWYKLLRRLDVQILWPACKQNAPNLTAAREAFYIHACLDPAWQYIGLERICDEVESLR